MNKKIMFGIMTLVVLSLLLLSGCKPNLDIGDEVKLAGKSNDFTYIVKSIEFDDFKYVVCYDTFNEQGTDVGGGCARARDATKV